MGSPGTKDTAHLRGDVLFSRGPRFVWVRGQEGWEPCMGSSEGSVTPWKKGHQRAVLETGKSQDCPKGGSKCHVLSSGLGVT